MKYRSKTVLNEGQFSCRLRDTRRIFDTNREKREQQNNQRTNQASCIIDRRTKNLMAHGVLKIATKFNINLSVLNTAKQKKF